MARAGVTVLGGGVIGLSIAWRAAQAGFAVAVRDRGSAHAGSWVAGGMLAPVSEAWPGDEAVLELGLDSIRLWPDFARELGVRLNTAGTLLTAVDAADAAVLDQHAEHLAARGLAFQVLGAAGLREREPGLGPSVRSGLEIPGDLAVSSRSLLAALRTACAEAGVRFPGPDESEVDGSTTVIAAGAWSAELHPALRGLIHPVKGEILGLLARPGALPPPERTIRARVRGRAVYLVPNETGAGLLVGATQYEAGFDPTVRVRGVLDLLTDAEEVWPALTEYALAETSVGFRAGSRDNAPLIGWLEPGVLAATGHHRNGVLLAPVTARRVVELLGEGA
ncbi:MULTISPECIES: glycine oxidase ThiO [Actinosynnema]|uniref:glycine oxidase ThiO n=1 Tax=Actinosynnema TaxID=40566 RepID=UPI0020A466DD|nr:glycine oxidase ThiO [Actinosynnema pretiosum]MCP2096811.1 glycine oxidase [Actinosynnema pretiosum]